MIRFFSVDERPDLGQRYWDEAEEIWPRYMTFVYHDPVCDEYWPRMETEFAAFQFVVYDEAVDRFLAVGNTIPFAWSGRDEDLPKGVPTVLIEAFAAM